MVFFLVTRVTMVCQCVSNEIKNKEDFVVTDNIIIEYNAINSSSK